MGSEKMEKTRNRVMIGCAVILCLVMASIFLRLFTRQLLVKRLHINNAFTRGVLFDRLGMQEEREQNVQTEIKINWESLYPFEKQEVNKQEANPLLHVVCKVVDQWNTTKSKIHDYTAENIAGYTMFVEWTNQCKQVFGWDFPRVGGDNSVVEGEDGQLVVFAKRTDTSWKSKEVANFADFCKAQGTAFLYVAAPTKIGRYDVYSGTVDFTNQNMDEFLAALKQRDIQFIDLRDNIEKAGIVPHTLFYRTDHHWLAETGLWASGLIAEYLNENHILQSDVSLLSPERYSKKTYKEWFLGTYGRKVTLARATPDDFSLLYPKFETKMHYVIPNIAVDRIGDFSTIYDMRQIEEKDYYGKSPYEGYNYGKRPLISIENCYVSNDDRIIIIGDSFTNCVAPFLALQCRHTDVVMLDSFTGSIKTFVAKAKPTAVIVLYWGAQISTEGEAAQKLYTFR